MYTKLYIHKYDWVTEFHNIIWKFKHAFLRHLGFAQDNIHVVFVNITLLAFCLNFNTWCTCGLFLYFVCILQSCATVVYSAIA